MKQLLHLPSFCRAFLLITVLLSFGVSASADSECDFSVNGICYNYIGGKTNEVAVTYRWYEGGRYGYGFSAHYTGSVTVPSTVAYDGKTYTVTAVGEDAFRECSVTSVYLPSTITSIGAWAFCDCSQLSQITLPEAVTTIGTAAFNGCINLYSIVIPGGVTTIGASAFADCRSLYSIAIPRTVTSIGTDAFVGTGWYNNQTDGPIYVGQILYKYKGTMSAGTTISLKDGTTSIAGSAFKDCTGLVSVNIPSSVTSIGSYAFSGCTSLNYVTLPKNIIGIENYVFQGCSSLSSIVIPESANDIGNYAFSGCSNLASITIPESVNGIGNYAFYNCSNLTSLTIPKNVKTFGETPFNGSGLTDLTILCSNVSPGLCQYLKSLQRVTFGENVENIEVSAFLGCNNLSSIVFNDKLTSISNSAFGGTAWYNNQPDGLVYAGKVVYKYKGSMNAGTEMVLVEGTKGIADQAFYGCLGLSAITIPEGVITIGNESFRNCSGLESIVLPNSLSKIGNSSFSGCTGLKTINLPKKVVSIGNNAFQDCVLESVIAKMETPVALSSNPFTYLSASTYYNYVNSMTLYVPAGCKEAYEAANVWKDFKEIIEMELEPEIDTDISQMDNVIYLNAEEGLVGKQLTLSLRMKNTAAIRGFQFDMYLPEGVTVVKNSKGRIQGSLSNGRLPEDDAHTLTISEQVDGAIRFLCGSQYNETFMGTDGEIATLTVSIAEDMEEGDYPIILKAMKLTETDISKFYETECLKSTLTVYDYILGDGNGDGKIDVSDYIGVANHIMGDTPTGFNLKATDVNQDGVIDVSDYIGIANLIMTGSIYGENNVKAVFIGTLQER